MRLERSSWLSSATMHASSRSLDARLAELVMSTLCPCDLGDGVEVVHDVEAVEVEMECDVDDDAAEQDADATLRFAMDEVVSTLEFARVDDVGTHQFVRYSAPYERIELQIDPQSFLRATIEDARSRTRRGSAGSR